jgi:predicted phage tail protein
LTVSGLGNLTTYYFKVFAEDAAGSSPPSGEAQATTLGPPSAPSGLIATPGNREVSLTWQAPTSDGGSALTGYYLYLGTSPGGEGAHFVASATSTSAVVRPLSNGTKYYFTVKAVNVVGPGPASSEASATPSA